MRASDFLKTIADTSHIFQNHGETGGNLPKRGNIKVAPLWQRVLVSLATIGLGVLIRLPLQSILHGHYPYLTFFPAVFVSAMYARWQLASVVAVASGIIAERFFSLPNNQFTIDAEHGIALGGFLLVCAGMIGAIEAMHRSEVHAQEATQKAEASEELLTQLNAELEERVRERTADLEGAHRALLAVMDGSPDPMAAVDLERRITAFNRAYADEFETRFGVRPKIQDRLDALLAPFPGEYAKLLALWQRAVQGLMVSEETLGDSQRGQRTYQINSSFIRDALGNPTELVYSVRDVTEHRQLQRQLEQMNEKLERQVTELESFAYSVAHDLRAPLRAITSLTTLLDSEYGVTAPPEAREYMQRVRRAAARMDALIRDLLVLSQVGRTEVTGTRIDLDALVGAIISESPELQSPHAEVLVQKPLGAVLGNEMLLTQSLSNLLGNSVKFVDAHPPRIVIRTERSRERLRLWVEDNGIGIDPQFHQKIFGIFERLDTRFEGTGVGLAIVRRAIERLGGKVGVESTVGQGSRFWFELPDGDDPLDSP